MDTLGKRIRYLRGSESQEDFARRLGVSKGSIGGYERDENSPSAEVITKIVSMDNISSRWLLLGQGPVKDDGSVDIPEAPQIPAGAVISLDDLYDIVEIFESFLQAQQKNLPPPVKAEVIRQLCQAVNEARSGKEEVRPGQLVRLVNEALAANG